MKQLVSRSACLASLAVIAASFGCATKPSPVKTETGQTPRRLETVVRQSVSVPYLLFLPADYRPDAPQPWPVMIFLHGAGERGADLEKVTVHGPPKLVRTRPDFPCVVVSPQCPAGEVWDVASLDALLDHVLASHRVDPKRVYLTGLSMGGFGSWNWASTRPERFAAVAPICGGGQPISVWLADGPRRERLARLPVWAFHGAKDTVVPPAESERMIEAFRRLGNDAKLTVYPDAGHDSWTATYDDPALLEWMLRQRQP